MTRTAIGAAAVVLSAPPISPSIRAYDELTSEQKDELHSAGTVVRYETVAGKPWPRSYVYMKLDGLAAKEVMAVFLDFNRHNEFIPEVSKSCVSNYEQPNTWHVDYVLNVPLFKDESYTVENRLSTYDDNTGYEVIWSKVRASSTREISGSIRIENHESGTFLSYYNFIVPGRSLSRLVERKARKQAVETPKAIGQEAHRLKADEPQRLQQLVQALERTGA